MEKLRWQTAAGMSSRNIALSLSIGATTVIDFLQRSRSAEMSWPQPEDMTDEALEARLFPASTALLFHPRSEFPSVPRS